MAISGSSEHVFKMRTAGFSLLEIVVALCIVAVSLTLIVGIIPMNVSGLKKSEAIQAATLYASEVLAQAESPAFVAEPATMFLDRTVVINQVPFRVVRGIYGVDAPERPRLYDVIVNVSWETQPVPVELRTRVYRP